MRTTTIACVLAHVLVVCLTACATPTSDELLGQARQAVSAGDLRTAEIHLKNLLQNSADNAPARALLGEVSLAQGELAAAEQSLRRALVLGADPAAIQIPLLRALLLQGKFDDVLEQARSGPTLNNPERTTELAIAAAAHRGLGSLGDAEAAYRSALEIDPRSLDIRTDLAGLYLQIGRVQEATQLIAGVLADQPDFAAALLLRGSIDLALRRFDEAQAAFEAILRQSEGSAPTTASSMAAAQLVQLQIEQGKTGEASARADELLARNAEDPTARYVKARVEVELGAVDDATRRLEGVIAQYPNYWPAYTLLGSLAANKGLVGQAESYLRAAVNGNPQDNTARLTLAELYVRRGDMESAKALIATENAETDALFLATMGTASARVGEPELAGEFFERSEETGPRSLQELIGISSAYVAAGEFERALRVIQSSSLDDGQNAWVSDYLMALVQIRQGDMAGAAQTAQGLTERFPKAAWLFNLQTTIALITGDVPAATEFAKRALEVDPKFIPALLNAARLAAGVNEKAEAAAYLRRVLEVDPQELVAVYGLAQLAADRGDYGEARSLLGRLPETAPRFRLEGEVAMAQSRFDEAAGSFSRAFVLQPSGPLALRSYVAARSAGRPQPEADLLAWVERDPEDAAVNFELGSVALARRDEETAIQRYEAVVRADPKHVGALNNLAWVYGQRRDARAIDLGLRAYEADPANAAIADTLGWAYVQLGEAAKGLPLLQDAAAAMPADLETRYHWAIALADTGDRAAAASLLRDLVAVSTDFPSRNEARARLAQLENQR